MALSDQTFGIIGGGIAGLSAAIALAQRGADVTVFEAAPDFGEVGAGLQLSANAVRVLAALGLDPLTKLRHNRPSNVTLSDYKHARRVVKLDLKNDMGRPFLQVHRADLIEFLAQAARQAGVETVLNTRVMLEPQTPTSISTDKSTFEFDAVIAADGVRSAARAHVAGTTNLAFTGYVAWRALIDASRLNGHPALQDARVAMGPKAHVVTYPLREGSLVNLVAVQQQDDWIVEGWMKEGDPQDLRARFDGWSREVTDLLEQVETCHCWGLFAHTELTTWSKGKTALIGDAAHPMLPFMAQGAAMSIEDAWVLAAALDAAPTIEDGLRTYETHRKPRATRVQKTALSNADIYHLSNPLVRRIAHFGMGALGAVAPSLISSRYDWIYDADVTKLEI